MNIPGFTAEKSLQSSRQRYMMTGHFRATSDQTVLPARDGVLDLKLCEWACPDGRCVYKWPQGWTCMVRLKGPIRRFEQIY